MIEPPVEYVQTKYSVRVNENLSAEMTSYNGDQAITVTITAGGYSVAVSLGNLMCILEWAKKINEKTGKK